MPFAFITFTCVSASLIRVKLDAADASIPGLLRQACEYLARTYHEKALVCLGTEGTEGTIYISDVPAPESGDFGEPLRYTLRALRRTLDEARVAYEQILPPEEYWKEAYEKAEREAQKNETERGITEIDFTVEDW